jgi:hypothetical protein
MILKRHLLISTILLCCLSPISLHGQSIRPEPIALPASEFPTPSAVLDQLVSSNDVAALRAHAWKLWSGLTADSSQSYNGKVLPIWETWLSEQEAFSSVSSVAALGQQRVLRPFAIPSQLRHRARVPANGLSEQFATNSDTSRVLAFVKLNSDAAGFVAVSHPGPAGSGNPISYRSNSDLERLNDYFNSHSTPLAERKIVDFPAAATNLKIVFMPVKANGLSPVPIWAGPEKSSKPANPSTGTWTECVAVDPTNSKSGSGTVTCNGKQVQAEVVHLDRFYSVRLDAARASAVTQLLNLSGESALADGDFQVLVAMHVTTKEIANWTWQTFWWQNGKDPPNKYPGSLDNLPDSSKVKGPWRNYVMCIADSIVVPSNDRNGSPVVCFNPYLEPGLAEGISSNCMSCHARATVPGAPYPGTYHPNGWIDPADATVFSGQTKTDFVWAIQNSAN